MDKKDYIVLQKINAHTESIINYCEDCMSLMEFEGNAMRVEATDRMGYGVRRHPQAA